MTAAYTTAPRGMSLNTWVELDGDGQINGGEGLYKCGD
jgi:hypothetical protein